MGTVTCCPNVDDSGDKYHRYLRYLGDEANPQLDTLFSEEQRVRNRKGGKKYLYTADKAGYEHHLYGYVKTKEGRRRYLSILYKPKRFMFNLPLYKFTWHQGEWEDQREVVITLTGILGFDHAYELFFKSKISRLDLWLDNNYKFSIMKRSVYLKNVAKYNCMGGKKLRSLYLGSQSSDQHVIVYEKLVKKDWLDFERGTNSGHGTRIELRLLYNRVPISCYADYYLLGRNASFDLLKSYFMSSKKWSEMLDSLSGQSYKLMHNFKRSIKEEHFQFAHEQCNDQRNFYKTAEKHLLEYAQVISFTEVWQDKVKFRIIGDFDIRDYFHHKEGTVIRNPSLKKFGFYYDHSPSYLQ